MTTAKTIRELDGWRGDAALVEMDDKHYVVSSVHAPYSGFETLVFNADENGNVTYSGFETLVFNADENGNVTDWLEVAGGRGMSRTAAIEDLESRVTSDA